MPHDDLDIEPVLGLPEAPPEGETILWQGAPLAWPLAKRALNAQADGLANQALDEK